MYNFYNPTRLQFYQNGGAVVGQHDRLDPIQEAAVAFFTYPLALSSNILAARRRRIEDAKINELKIRYRQLIDKLNSSSLSREERVELIGLANLITSYQEVERETDIVDFFYFIRLI